MKNEGINKRCCPTLAQLNSIVQNVRAWNKLHKDAFKAVHIWANIPASKDFIISYKPYSKREGSRFHCIMATPFSLDSMIGWPENGVYLDSSWRHKNDANLPLTLMVTSHNPNQLFEADCFGRDTSAGTEVECVAGGRALRGQPRPDLSPWVFRPPIV